MMLAISKPVSANLLQRCALFPSRISLPEAKYYAKLLAREPIKPSLELAMVAFKSIQIDIPIHIVASTGDRIFSTGEEKLLADAYGGEMIVVNDLCHDMMLDPDWECAAEATAKLIRRIEHQLQLKI